MLDRFNKITQKKEYPQGYTENIINNVKLITIDDKDIINLFGSASYRIQPFPADIDISEIYEEKLSRKQLINKFSKKLKNVIRNILKSNFHFITEIKIGLDDRYIFNIGSCVDGVYKPDINNILINTDNLFNNKLLSMEDYTQVNNIMDLAIKNNGLLNSYEYDLIFNIFRKYYILRWTADEVLMGKKRIINKYISIEDALNSETMTKIDMITKINGDKIVEITNFILLIDGDNNIINLGKKKDYGFLNKLAVDGLPFEIEKLLYSDFYFSPFKACKRIWALARILKDGEMIDKITPIINGRISFLYSLQSQIKTIILLYDTNPQIKFNDIYPSLENIRYNINNIMEISKDDLNIYFNLFDKFYNNHDYNILSIIADMMQKTINFYTIHFLKYNRVVPLNFYYLPTVAKYVHILKQ